jgi:hypothetical protein
LKGKISLNKDFTIFGPKTYATLVTQTVSDKCCVFWFWSLKYITWLTTLKHPYFSTQQIRITQRPSKELKCVLEKVA